MNDILDYWFEGVNDQTKIDKKRMPFLKWFSGGTRIDAEIRSRFEGVYLKALEGGLKSWEETPRGTLALIVLLDQFPRNIYRNSPRMFESDSLALALTLHAIEKKSDTQLLLIERVFLYMPFQHAEDPAMQEKSLGCFERLVEESKKINPANTSYYAYTLDYARRHHAIIEEFGRFPHRNVLLKRPSTAAEQEFFLKKGSSF